MTEYFLGVDTGGTKSHALIATGEGQAIGIGHAGPGNHESVGYHGVIATLRECTSQALAMAGLEPRQISGAGFGLAGYDWPSERKPHLEVIATLGLQCPLEPVNDMVVGLIAGSSQGWGVVVDAGTGNNCRGRAPDGRDGYMTGCGGTFGEYGGAGELVDHVIQKISHEWTRRGPKTLLTPAFIKLVGARDLDDLLEGLALGYYTIDADTAPLVFQIAREGDKVARQCIAWTGRELGSSATGIIRQIGMEDMEFEVVLIGSMFKGGPLLLDPLRRTIRRVAPRARFVRLTAPPVVGGVLLGMEITGRKSPGVRETLIKSTEKIMG